MTKRYTVNCGTHTLTLGEATCIMGILNVTPDSFSDGGRFFSPDVAVGHARRMVADGAEIIDIGGESTRPFSEPVGEEEEIRRVVPVIERLAEAISVPISVDTTKASVAERAIAAGASIINDISAFEIDPAMADVAAKTGAPVILMHMKGTPRDMQIDPSYEDLVGEIKNYLEGRVEAAVRAGISRSKIIVDPGIGFGKTVQHNMALINHLDVFGELDLPVLIGPSRKSFIRKTLEGLPDPDAAVETGTQAALTASILRGAHIVRVHDVPMAAATVGIADAIRKA